METINTEVQNCEKCNVRMEHKTCCCSEKAMGYESKLECPTCKAAIYKKKE